MLTLNVLEPSYFGLTWSILWLLMPWLLASPGHQQPLYWSYRISRPFSYLRNDFNYQCHINVEEWHKCKYMFMFHLKKIAHKRLTLNTKYTPCFLSCLQVHDMHHNCRPTLDRFPTDLINPQGHCFTNRFIYIPKGERMPAIQPSMQ